MTLQSVGMFSKIIIYYLCLNNSGHLGRGIVDFHFLSILGTRVSWSEKFEEVIEDSSVGSIFFHL